MGAAKQRYAAVEPGLDRRPSRPATGASGVLIVASAVDPRELDRVVRHLVGSGLHVQISTGLARIGHQRMRPSPLSHQLLFYVERPKLSPWQHVLKRTIDVVVASVASVVAAPVLVAAAIAIKLDDGGSITYRQERIGRDGRGFRSIKLRTMIPNASSQLAELVALNERNGPLFKLGHDPRVTRVGRFLRATSIDELPQLFNVLRGEMSLVGPRPALPDEVAQFDVELLDRGIGTARDHRSVAGRSPGQPVIPRLPPAGSLLRRQLVGGHGPHDPCGRLSPSWSVGRSAPCEGGSEILGGAEPAKPPDPPSARCQSTRSRPAHDAGVVGR